MTKNIINVGMSEIKIATDPADELVVMGLGSCIAFVAYDLDKCLAIMCHVVLPSSAKADQETLEKGKYADTSIKEALDLIVLNGARRSRLEVKIAGGSKMLKINREEDVHNIGERNAAAVLEEIKKYGLNLKSSHIGGDRHRNVRFALHNRSFYVKVYGEDEKQI